MSDHPKRRLLPCPFCGGQPSRRDNAGLWAIECRECGATSATWEHYQSARASWNKRTPNETDPTKRGSEGTPK